MSHSRNSKPDDVNEIVKEIFKCAHHEFSSGRSEIGLKRICSFLLRFRQYDNQKTGEKSAFYMHQKINAISKNKVKNSVYTAMVKNADTPLAHLIYAIYLARIGAADKALEKYDQIHDQFPDYQLAYKHHLTLLKYKQLWNKHQKLQTTLQNIILRKKGDKQVATNDKEASPRQVLVTPFSLFSQSYFGNMTGSTEEKPGKPVEQAEIKTYYQLF